MLDLEELERLHTAATPGPWFVTCNCTGKTFYTIKNDRVYIGEALGVYNGEANAAYIVAACNVLPRLIDIARYLAGCCVKMDAELGNEDLMTVEEWLELAKLNTKEGGE